MDLLDNVATNTFDPTSSANLTALGVIVAGMSSLVSAAYSFGKFRSEKKRSEYQMSMLCIVFGLVLFYVGYYIGMVYD
jgi:hypothetical protein